jgi:glutamate dehydrogenase
MTEKQRNRLLAKMTDEVGELVLRNNYLQSQALSVLEGHSATFLEQQVRYMRALERAGQLNPEIEFLPDEEALQERRSASQGLTRPELSVLLAYAKMVLYEEFLESDLTDSEYLVDDVVEYFPTPLRKKHRAAVLGHQLRKEILATSMANSIVNRTGITFVHDVMEETGESAEAVARAYAAARDAYGLAEIWSEIEALDNRVPRSGCYAIGHNRFESPRRSRPSSPASRRWRPNSTRWRASLKRSSSPRRRPTMSRAAPRRPWPVGSRASN